MRTRGIVASSAAILRRKPTRFLFKAAERIRVPIPGDVMRYFKEPDCIPSAEVGHTGAGSEETLSGAMPPEERLDMSRTKKQSTEAAVREIRRRTRRKFAPEEKIRIVLEGLRGEQSISELCRREGIAANLYYRWSKDFLEAGKKQLAGDTVREATSDEVKELRAENRELKEVVAEVTLKNRVLKKSWTGHGEEDAT
jgi:transposase